MKRLIGLLLLFSMLLSGCSMGERIKEPVTFYYIQENYQEEMGNVIAPEVREASGHRYDLAYLLALYSMGPSKAGLVSPFPVNTMILPVEHSEDGLVLSILDEIQDMTDAQYTLASACLATTFMEIIDVEQITVICGDRSVTLKADSLLTNSAHIVTTPEERK